MLDALALPRELRRQLLARLVQLVGEDEVLRRVVQRQVAVAWEADLLFVLAAAAVDDARAVEVVSLSRQAGLAVSLEQSSSGSAAGAPCR